MVINDFSCLFAHACRSGREQVRLVRGEAVAQWLLQLQEVWTVPDWPWLPDWQGWHPVSWVWERHIRKSIPIQKELREPISLDGFAENIANTSTLPKLTNYFITVNHVSFLRIRLDSLWNFNADGYLHAWLRCICGIKHESTILNKMYGQMECSFNKYDVLGDVYEGKKLKFFTSVLLYILLSQLTHIVTNIIRGNGIIYIQNINLNNKQFSTGYSLLCSLNSYPYF